MSNSAEKSSPVERLKCLLDLHHGEHGGGGGGLCKSCLDGAV